MADTASVAVPVFRLRRKISQPMALPKIATAQMGHAKRHSA